MYVLKLWNCAFKPQKRISKLGKMCFQTVKNVRLIQLYVELHTTEYTFKFAGFRNSVRLTRINYEIQEREPKHLLGTLQLKDCDNTE